MNKVVYGLLVVCLMSFVACSQEEPFKSASSNEQDQVSLNFSAIISKGEMITTRADAGNSRMYLLVFDENGHFLMRKQATILDKTSTGGSFTVELPVSSKPRTIHFITNYDWSNFDDDKLVGVNETTLITALNTDTPTLWACEKLTSGISSNVFDGKEIKFLRNEAKITVTNLSPKFQFLGFAIYNAPQEGTVVPFDNSSGAIDKEALTEPDGLRFKEVSEADIDTEAKYLFERNYKLNPEVTGIVVKGIFEGNTYYYKLDLINYAKIRYDIKRNYHYLVKLENVIDAGASSLEEALEGDFHNNAAIDPSIEKYPIISDGVRKLEVDRVLLLLTKPGQKFSIQSNYYPDINSTATANEQIWVSYNTITPTSAINRLDGGLADGLLTHYATLALPGEVTRQTNITFSAGGLERTVKVYYRKPYSFEPVTLDGVENAVIKDAEQGTKTTLRFTIPEDFPDALFPLPVKIYTQGLYSKSSKVEIGIEDGGKIYYLYYVREKGEHVLDLHLNNPFSEETIEVTSDYFNTGTASYRPDFFTIYGRIDYQWRSWILGAKKWLQPEKGEEVQMKENGNPIPPGTEIKVIEKGQYRLRIPYHPKDQHHIRIRFQIQEGYQTKSITQFQENTWLMLSIGE